MNYIQTYTGKRFNLFEPDVGAIDIEDIAHSLSMLCRFNGHCQKFYSVAEHSVNVSLIVPEEYALSALMHDAAEAYFSDMPYPVKVKFPDFSKSEDTLFAVIADYYNIPKEMPNEVHKADKIMLATEQLQLLREPPESWENLPKPHPNLKLLCLAPEDAKSLFLKRFNELNSSH